MPAHKGNRYAVGNNGGRPPIYENAESLFTEVNEYFQYIEGEGEYKEFETQDEDGNIKKYKEWVWERQPEPATITGLSMFLGFANRQSLYDYRDRNEEYSVIIKNAICRVEHEYEKQLQRDKPTGAIFALKNMGWADSAKVDHTTQGEKIIDGLNHYQFNELLNAARKNASPSGKGE